MVRLLSDLRRTVVRHQLEGSSAAPIVAALVLALLSVAGTLVLGATADAGSRTDEDLLAAILALWLGGQLTQSALSGGDATLRPAMFALLPIPRRRVARALLLTGLLNPALLFVGLAFAALVPGALGAGAGTTAVALVATVLATVLTGVLATLAGGVLGPGSGRGRDRGTVVLAGLISLVAIAGTLLPAVARALHHGTAPVLSQVVRLLPSGWPTDAVHAAAGGHWVSALLPLGALAALTLAAAAAWPVLLGRRMRSAGSPDQRGARAGGRRRLLPGTPVGAVAAKELVLWGRDPIRLTCLLIAFLVGLGVCVVPWVDTGTTLLLPFAGALTTLIGGACASNLHASDGTSLWLTLMVPDGSRPDVLGRQLAWLVLTVPYALLCAVGLSAATGDPALWPWSLALTVSLIGAGAGLAPIASLIAVQPLDDTGNPSPGFSIKVHVMLVVLLLAATPTVGVLALGQAEGSSVLRWLAVPVGAASGLLLTVALGRRAARRLDRRGLAILRELAG